MKIFPNCINITTILFFLSFNTILNEDCKFIDEKGKVVYADENHLKDLESEDKKSKCFSFSNSFVQSGKCCYHKINNTCVAENPDNNTNIECPIESTIYNNCGKCGIYEPQDIRDCTEIPLVKGYCCHVKFKNHGASCLRTKILNKDINSTTEQMKKYIEKIDKSAEIEKVTCKGFKLKYSLLLIIINFLLIF